MEKLLRHTAEDIDNAIDAVDQLTTQLGNVDTVLDEILGENE